MNISDYIEQFGQILEDSDIAMSNSLVNKFAVLAVELQSDVITLDEIVRELYGVIPAKKLKDFDEVALDEILNEFAEVIFDGVDSDSLEDFDEDEIEE